VRDGAAPATRDREATRARIERAALEQFDRYGFDKVTTTQIAGAAGVSPRTFFRHFPTKVAALLGDTGARTYEFVLGLHRQPLDRSLKEAVIGAIAAHDDEASYGNDLIRAKILRDTPSLADALRTYEAGLEAHFAEWIAQRCRRTADDYEVRVVAAVMVAARRTIIEQWRLTAGRVPIVELARQALDMIDLRLDRGGSIAEC
jgi:AcrR family transcriptional regulator